MGLHLSYCCCTCIACTNWGVLANFSDPSENVVSSHPRPDFIDGTQVGHCFAGGFACTEHEQSTARKRTKRENFLAEMEAVVPWQPLIDLIEAHYPKTSSKGGRPTYPLATILRIHLL
jgi:hypothetical protein